MPSNHSPTTEQLAAVESELPATVVSAAPGSGKTTVLAARIAWLIRNLVPPEQILALTFTRSACQEIRQRVQREIGALAERVRIETFHGYAWSVLREPSLSVATEVEAQQAIRSIIEGPTRRRGTPGLRAIEEAIIDHESGRGFGPHADALRLIVFRLREAGLVPTWDLVPSIERREESFDHVLVDEAQDVTPREAQLVRRLTDGTLFAVFDRAQAIMGWRGGIGIDWPVTHRLSQSFRFGPEIAAAANTIAVRMGTDPVVGAGPAGQVIEGSIEQILEAEGTRAVLCRTHRECEWVARDLGPLAVHVTRDLRDALDSNANRFEGIARAVKIAVATIHAAKGREWDSVAVVPWEHRENEDLRVEDVA